MTNLWVATPAAVLAAASFGVTSALQHHAARRTPEVGAVRVRTMLQGLFRQPEWLASLLTNGMGIALQWLALATAPLVFVQPLLVLSLIFAIITSSVMSRHRPDRSVLFGAGLCVAGLAVFFPLAQPTSGPGDLVLAEVPWLAGGLFAIMAACLMTAVRSSGQVRVLALAGATGVLYGVAAGLTKLAAADLEQGIGTLLTSWHFYLVFVCGVTGFVLSQNAFRVGVAVSPALAVMVALDPLVSLGVGVLWLGEGLHNGPGAATGQVLALAVLVVGIGILSRKAPQAVLAAEQGSTGDETGNTIQVTEPAVSERADTASERHPRGIPLAGDATLDATPEPEEGQR